MKPFFFFRFRPVDDSSFDSDSRFWVGSAPTTSTTTMTPSPVKTSLKCIFTSMYIISMPLTKLRINENIISLQSIINQI